MTRIPALSKHYLRGTSDDIALHPIDWYEQRSIAAPAETLRRWRNGAAAATGIERIVYLGGVGCG